MHPGTITKTAGGGLVVLAKALQIIGGVIVVMTVILSPAHQFYEPIFSDLGVEKPWVFRAELPLMCAVLAAAFGGYGVVGRVRGEVIREVFRGLILVGAATICVGVHGLSRWTCESDLKYIVVSPEIWRWAVAERHRLELEVNQRLHLVEADQCRIYYSGRDPVPLQKLLQEKAVKEENVLRK